MGKRASFHDLINGDQPLLIDFFAEWCGPCKAMAPVLKELAGEVKGKARIIKIDIDKNQAISTKLGIRGVPTFILYKKGESVWRQSGMQSIHAFKEAIESALEN
jgi:thioredoxin 1